jgi:predicted ester cyclase
MFKPTERWTIDGDLVTSRVSFSGTQQGELMGVAPTGKPVTWTHLDIHRVQNGKITDIWHNIPVADILEQLGYTLVPPVQ